MEVRAAERLPTAMRTWFNVAARAMAFADGRAAIGTGSERLAHASFNSQLELLLGDFETFHQTEPK